MSSNQELTKVAKDYYDSPDADEFYHQVWGGEDIHVGIYLREGEPIAEAGVRTVERMAEIVGKLDKDVNVLDIGAGYGGAGRFLARTFGCPVECLNLSEKENERNREKTAAAGLSDLVSVTDGSFDAMPYPDSSYDVVWSEDALLHAPDKAAVFAEVARVLKPGGVFVFTDPMQADDAKTEELGAILKRIHLSQMGSVKRYKELAQANGLKAKTILEMPEQLVNHYSSVLAGLTEHEGALKGRVSQNYIDNMKAGLGHWIEGGKEGRLNWGILAFEKPAN